MPKGERKSKSNKRGGGLKVRAANFSDDDSANGDACSTLSAYSDRGSLYDEGDNGNDGLEDDSYENRSMAEEKVSEAIESLVEKSASARVEGLKTLIALLSQQFVPDLFLNRRETLRDNLEKVFRKGQRTEQGLAAEVVQLAMLQFGAYDLEDATADFNSMRPTLQTIVNDHTVPGAVRAKAIDALCFGAFLADTNLEDIIAIMGMLKPLFMKKKKTVGAPEADAKGVKTGSNLAAAAISGWTLMATLLPDHYIQEHCFDWLDDFQKLLDDSELEVRLNAGEALAVIVELGELYDESEDDEDGSDDYNESTSQSDEDTSETLRSLIEKLKSLSVESKKHQAKRDRRTQRHNFRDFLRAVERGEGPDVSLKFGHGEQLEIDSWAKKRRYEAIANVLGSGINRQLAENGLLRQILELGPPMLIASDGTGTKVAKHERHYQNSVNFKVRSVARGKSRDLRRHHSFDD